MAALESSRDAQGRPGSSREQRWRSHNYDSRGEGGGAEILGRLQKYFEEALAFFQASMCRRHGGGLFGVAENARKAQQITIFLYLLFARENRGRSMRSFCGVGAIGARELSRASARRGRGKREYPRPLSDPPSDHALRVQSSGSRHVSSVTPWVLKSIYRKAAMERWPLRRAVPLFVRGVRVPRRLWTLRCIRLL